MLSELLLGDNEHVRNVSKAKQSKAVVLYPSDSASAKTSSASSPVPGSVVVDRLPVEVVTMGTDWDACSEASAEALSVNTVTGEHRHP